jgi:hypothetical protein
LIISCILKDNKFIHIYNKEKINSKDLPILLKMFRVIKESFKKRVSFKGTNFLLREPLGAFALIPASDLDSALSKDIFAIAGLFSILPEADVLSAVSPFIPAESMFLIIQVRS